MSNLETNPVVVSRLANLSEYKLKFFNKDGLDFDTSRITEFGEPATQQSKNNNFFSRFFSYGTEDYNDGFASMTFDHEVPSSMETSDPDEMKPNLKAVSTKDANDGVIVLGSKSSSNTTDMTNNPQTTHDPYLDSQNLETLDSLPTQPPASTPSTERNISFLKMKYLKPEGGSPQPPIDRITTFAELGIAVPKSKSYAVDLDFDIDAPPKKPVEIVPSDASPAPPAINPRLNLRETQTIGTPPSLPSSVSDSAVSETTRVESSDPLQGPDNLPSDPALQQTPPKPAAAAVPSATPVTSSAPATTSSVSIATTSSVPAATSSAPITVPALRTSSAPSNPPTTQTSAPPASSPASSKFGMFRQSFTTLFQTDQPQPAVQAALGNNTSNSAPASPAIPRSPSSTTLQKKDFWMPDHEVKLCYECQSSFSTFKRRHHCRLCGQIFCSKCSQNTLKIGNESIRVCNSCFKSKSKLTTTPAVSNADSASTASNLATSPPTPSQLPSATSSTDSIPSVTSTTEAHVEQILEGSVEQPERQQLLDSEDFISQTYQPVQVPDVLRDYTVSHVGKKDLSSDALGTSPTAVPPVAVNSTAEGNEQREKDIMYLRQNMPPSWSLQEIPRKLRKANTLGADVFTKSASSMRPRTDSEISQMHFESLREQSDQLLQDLLHQLINEEQLDSLWFDVVLKFARKACENVKPRIRLGDKMDIREYVKVKTLPDGDVQECQYTNGVVFKKNLAHKKMNNNISAPKILLLNCGIEFQKNRLLQLDDVLSQEKSYLKILVSRLAALEPDVVLVSQTVSRVAQEFFMECNIPFVKNIKPGVIRRIARATNADILKSATDHVLNPRLGRCQSLFVKTFKGSWGKSPMVFVDGCDKSLGCTILLRGASKDILRKVKKIMLFTTYAAHNLMLENKLLFDEYCSVLKTSPLSLSSHRAPIAEVMAQVNGNNHALHRILSCSPGVQLPKSLHSSNLFTTSPANPIAMKDSSQTIENPSNAVNPVTIIAEYQFDSLLLKKIVRLKTIGPSGTTEGFDSDDDQDILDQTSVNSQYVDVSIMNSPYSHQQILYLHSLCCQSTQKQCLPYEINLIEYYSKNDITIGQYLEHYCFDRSLKCESPGCNRLILEHERCFVHGDGRLNVSISKADLQLKLDMTIDSESNSIITWTLCKVCGKITPFKKLTEEAWNYSFGKFLELSFYCFEPHSRIGPCNHSIHKDHIRFFYWDDLIAEFEYEKVNILETSLSPLTTKRGSQTNSKIVTHKDLQLATEMGRMVFNALVRRLNQLEIELKRSQPDQTQDLLNKWKHEKTDFFEKLDALKKEPNPSWAKLSELKRMLYQNTIAWKNLLTEIVPKEVVKRKSHRHHRDHSESNITIQDLISQREKESPSASPHHLLKEKDSVFASASVESENAMRDLAGSDDKLSDSQSTPSSARGSLDNVLEALPDPTPVATWTASAPLKRKEQSEDNVQEAELNTPGEVDAEELQNSNDDTSNLPKTLSSPAAAHASGTLLDDIPAQLDTNKPTIESATALLVSLLTNPPVPTSPPTPSPIFLPAGVNDVTCVVYENEPSSFIAYALSSHEYKRNFESFSVDKGQSDLDSRFGEDAPLLRTLLSRTNTDIHYECKSQISSRSVNMYCITFFAKQFHALRSFCGGEEQYVQSLIRCKAWDARGGKSGASFCKTLDDRFILKEVLTNELKSFLEVAPLYFEYLSNALFQQVPTMLAKIFGVYSLVIERSGGKTTTQHLIVMENLFHNRTISRCYDLKGSQRSRYVRNPNENEVLLDENLSEVMFTDPIWVEALSKAKLQAAIWNDSLFLSSLGVMDYSLLVGVDQETKTLVVGIIDYMRQYTWDKQLETWVKSTGIMGGIGKIPTVISPKQYKTRFREAMNLYFVMVPNKNTNFRLKKFHPVVKKE